MVHNQLYTYYCHTASVLRSVMYDPETPDPDVFFLMMKKKKI